MLTSFSCSTKVVYLGFNDMAGYHVIEPTQENNMCVMEVKTNFVITRQTHLLPDIFHPNLIEGYLPSIPPKAVCQHQTLG